MGIFGDDKRQDERIAALESHVRMLTETVHANQADLAEGRIAILELQAQVDEKVSSSDVDPTIVKLNQELATARKQLEEASATASESWATMQKGVRDAFETLRKSVGQASDQIKKA
jgi:hypothetical protein